MRRRMRTRLARAPSTFFEPASREIWRRIRRSDAWCQAQVVALFSSLSGEVETGRAISDLWDAGQKVLLPRMVSAGDLAFHEFPAGAELVRGPYGVLEPAASFPPVELALADVVVVPGLAFDRSGGRLGRGAGYYDRALAAARARAWRESARPGPLAVGLGFGFQLVEGVPMEPADFRLDAVVTETEQVGNLSASGSR